MPNLQRCVYTAPGLSFLPPYLTPEFSVKRSNAVDDLVELLVAPLGDQYHSAPHLIVGKYMMLKILADSWNSYARAVTI